MSTSYKQIMSGLKSGQFAPVYFLAGDEPYYIDQIAEYIQNNALGEAERDFNQTVMYGKDTEVGHVLETAKRFPMMAERQVVIVKEAQALKKLEELQPYLENPLDTTVLVVCHKKKLDKRKAFSKTIAKHSLFFESEKIKDYKVGDWVLSYLTGKGMKISPTGANLIAESLGSDLSKMVNELDKLELVVEKGTEISPEIIQRYIGISKDFNVFELQNALAKRNALKAHQIIKYFGDNSKNHPLLVTIGSLFSYFTKLLHYHYLPDKSAKNVASQLKINPYFVKDTVAAANNYRPGKLVDIIKTLRDFDLKAKGVGSAGASESELGKELVARILAN